MNISFALTTEQFRNKTKTVTRRTRWRTLVAGTVLNAVEKGMGLKKGEHPVHMGKIRVVSVRRERLKDITPEDVKAEGFPDMTPAQFVEMFCAHMGVHKRTKVTRIEFEYL